jgi:hypothetical protein
MEKFVKTVALNWELINAHIKEKIGKKYSVNYLRQVIKGYESNSKLEPVLKEMGLMEIKQ